MEKSSSVQRLNKEKVTEKFSVSCELGLVASRDFIDIGIVQEFVGG
jgi:hypothetical protein